MGRRRTYPIRTAKNWGRGSEGKIRGSYIPPGGGDLRKDALAAGRGSKAADPGDIQILVQGADGILLGMIPEVEIGGGAGSRIVPEKTTPTPAVFSLTTVWGIKSAAPKITLRSSPGLLHKGLAGEQSLIPSKVAKLANALIPLWTKELKSSLQGLFPLGCAILLPSFEFPGVRQIYG